MKLGVGDEIEVYKANKITPAIAQNNTRSGTFHKHQPLILPIHEQAGQITSLLGTKAIDSSEVVVVVNRVDQEDRLRHCRAWCRQQTHQGTEPGREGLDRTGVSFDD